MGYLGTKPANAAVTSEQIADGAVSTADIAANAVTQAKLSTGAPDWDTSSNLKFNSGYGSNAIAYGCRAWVNFNGTGTVAIRGSGNVSSISDNGVGEYTVNFATAMPDGNFAAQVTVQNSVSSDFGNIHVGGISTSTARVSTFRSDTNGAADCNAVHVSIFR